MSIFALETLGSNFCLNDAKEFWPVSCDGKRVIVWHNTLPKRQYPIVARHLLPEFRACFSTKWIILKVDHVSMWLMAWLVVEFFPAEIGLKSFPIALGCDDQTIHLHDRGSCSLPCGYIVKRESHTEQDGTLKGFTSVFIETCRIVVAWSVHEKG